MGLFLLRTAPRPGQRTDKKGGRQCALTATRGRRDFFEEAIGDDNIPALELEQVQSKLDSYWMHDFVSFALCSIMPL
ncbi:MAG: hypothetical protein DMG13_29845 [Acidobacteria bacterium]|nr:MAG: hypothetical protein DMG13_29845 [Acidobacteriota bacterium]